MQLSSKPSNINNDAVAELLIPTVPVWHMIDGKYEEVQSTALYNHLDQGWTYQQPMNCSLKDKDGKTLLVWRLEHRNLERPHYIETNDKRFAITNEGAVKLLSLITSLEPEVSGEMESGDVFKLMINEREFSICCDRVFAVNPPRCWSDPEHKLETLLKASMEAINERETTLAS